MKQILRFFVAWNDVAEAYIVHDRHQIRKENKKGFAILWGTDSPFKSTVDAECTKLNSDPAYAKLITGK